MRAVLKPQDANVAGTNAGALAKQSAASMQPETYQQPQLQEEEERDSMRTWRQRWRAIMKDAIIYFDGISQQHIDKFKSYLAVLGSTVQPFFDQKVTHVISDNYRTELTTRAREMGLKVYNVEKLARFLSSLLNQPLTTVLDAHQSAKLAQMLEKDSRMSAFATSNYRKEDIHYFKGPYVLVWDPTMYNRPLVVKEWKMAENPEEGEWPQLRRAPIGISPFAARAVVKAEKRKYQEAAAISQQIQQHQHQQQNQQQKETKSSLLGEPSTHQVSKRAECDVFKDIHASKHANEHESTTSKKRPSNYYPNDADKENYSVPLRHGNAQVAIDSPMPAQLTNSVRLREFGEIVASGVPRYSATSNRSILGREALASREMNNLRRKVMPRHTPCSHVAETEELVQQPDKSMRVSCPPTHEAAVPQTSASVSTNTPVSASVMHTVVAPVAVSATSTASKTTNIGEPRAERRPLARLKSANKKPGYCENCLERYDDLSEHLVSKTHRQFAATESKFASLDGVIALLRR